LRCWTHPLIGPHHRLRSTPQLHPYLRDNLERERLFEPLGEVYCAHAPRENAMPAAKNVVSISFWAVPVAVRRRARAPEFKAPTSSLARSLRMRPMPEGKQRRGVEEENEYSVASQWFACFVARVIRACSCQRVRRAYFNFTKNHYKKKSSVPQNPKEARLGKSGHCAVAFMAACTLSSHAAYASAARSDRSPARAASRSSSRS
jgi:hypothetical protein